MRPKVRSACDGSFEALTYGRLREKVLSEGLLVLKCSGKLVGGPAILSVARLKQSGRLKNLVIVPGAQAQITKAMEQRRLKPRFIDGRRVTDAPAMRIAKEQICNVVHDIANSMHALEIKAEPVIFRTFYGEPVGPGNRTGIITRVACGPASLGLLCGKVVVLAPLGEEDGVDVAGGDGDSRYLSFNADDAAVSAAMNLGATRLIIAMDKDGIEKSGKVLPEITVSGLAGLMSDGTITGGMVAKAEACIYAAKAGIQTWLVNGNDPDAVERVLGGEGCGTAVLPVWRGAAVWHPE